MGRGPGDGRKGLRDRPRATLTGRPSVPERGTARSAGDCSGRRQPTRRLGGGGSYVCSHTERWPKPPRGGPPGAQRLLCAPSKHEPPGRLRRAPGAPSLPVPGPRSPVRRPSFTSRGALTRLCFLPLATEETDEDDGPHVLCAVCHARSGVCQACARRCPACRPALSPSALTTGGRVRARFRLRHAGPESVPQHSGPRSPLSGVPLRPAWVHSAVLPRLPPRHLSGPVLLLCHL